MQSSGVYSVYSVLVGVIGFFFPTKIKIYPKDQPEAQGLRHSFQHIWLRPKRSTVTYIDSFRCDNLVVSCPVNCMILRSSQPRSVGYRNKLHARLWLNRTPPAYARYASHAATPIAWPGWLQLASAAQRAQPDIENGTINCTRSETTRAENVSLQALVSTSWLTQPCPRSRSGFPVEERCLSVMGRIPYTMGSGETGGGGLVVALSPIETRDIRNSYSILAAAAARPGNLGVRSP